MNYPLLTALEKSDAVVLANGQFPTHPLPLALLKAAKVLVACDGAALKVPHPDVVIGDGDSLSEAVKERLKGRLILQTEQDDNDLSKASRYCLAQGFEKITYLGATGLREDHTTGNLSLLVRYLKEMGIHGTMATDYGWFVAARGANSFESRAGMQVSVFNFGCQQLAGKGLKWPCRPFEELWQGTLNEALSEQFGIDADGYYLVFRTYESKT